MSTRKELDISIAAAAPLSVSCADLDFLKAVNSGLQQYNNEMSNLYSATRGGNGGLCPVVKLRGRSARPELSANLPADPFKPDPKQFDRAFQQRGRCGRGLQPTDRHLPNNLRMQPGQGALGRRQGLSGAMTRRKCMNRLFVIAALSLFIAMPGVKAQEKKKGRGLVGALLGVGAGAAAAKAKPNSYGPNDLRPEALRDCLNSAHRLDEGDEKLGASATKIKAEGKSIDAENAALEREGKRDFTEQAQVDRYNARVRALKARIESFNREIGAHKVKAAGFDRGSDEFNKQCAGKKYYASDLAAIRGQLNFDPAKYAAK